MLVICLWTKTPSESGRGRSRVILCFVQGMRLQDLRETVASPFIEIHDGFTEERTSAARGKLNVVVETDSSLRSIATELTHHLASKVNCAGALLVTCDDPAGGAANRAMIRPFSFQVIRP